VWDEHRGQIDLVLTDMIMPGRMTGSDLVNELKKRKPSLKVIITSGYSDELAAVDFNHADTRFLPKPYQTHMVAQLIRKTLDTPAARSPAASARSAAGGEAKPALPRTPHVITHPPASAVIQGTRTASTSAV
jgi:DNA-binding NtrC family response regulator